MEPKILNFPDAMKLAEKLVTLEVDWMFFDSSLSPQDFLELFLLDVPEDDLIRIFYAVVGKQYETLGAKEAVELIFAGFAINKVPLLIETYRKNWVK